MTKKQAIDRYNFFVIRYCDRYKPLKVMRYRYFQVSKKVADYRYFYYGLKK